MVRDGYESNSSASSSTGEQNKFFGPLKLLWDVSKLHFACCCGEEPPTTRDSYPCVNNALWLASLHQSPAYWRCVQGGAEDGQERVLFLSQCAIRGNWLSHSYNDSCSTFEPPLIRKGTVPYRSWRSLWSPFQQTRCESETLSPVPVFRRLVAVFKVYVTITFYISPLIFPYDCNIYLLLFTHHQKTKHCTLCVTPWKCTTFSFSAACCFLRFLFCIFGLSKHTVIRFFIFCHNFQLFL